MSVHLQLVSPCHRSSSITSSTHALSSPVPSSAIPSPHSAPIISQSPTAHPATSSSSPHQPSGAPYRTPALVGDDTARAALKTANQCAVSALRAPSPHSATSTKLAAASVSTPHPAVPSLATRTPATQSSALAQDAAPLSTLSLAAHVGSLSSTVGSHVRAHL